MGNDNVVSLAAPADARRVFDVASSLQRVEGVHGAGRAKLDQDEPDSFLLRRFVSASPVKAAALNAELADQIASRAISWRIPGCDSFAFWAWATRCRSLRTRSWSPPRQ